MARPTIHREDKPVYLRLTPELYKFVKTQAKDNERSMGRQIVVWLKKIKLEAP